MAKALTRVAGKAGQELGEFLLEHREEELDRPLPRLEQDVPHEPLADDHAGMALVNVAALHIPHEPVRQRARLEQRGLPW